MSVTLQQAVNNAYLLATGKPAGLDLTSTKGLRMLQLANFYSGDWASDRTTDWHSMRQIFTLGATVTATDTFSLTSLTTLHHVSRTEGDFVRIYHTNGVDESDYTIVEASKLYADGRALNQGGISTPTSTGTVAQVGTNLVFSTPFLSTDAQIGGSIKLPGYIAPTTLVNATDVVQVDDPEWLETRMAAEFCRNDITRVQLYPSLKDEADDKMADMRAANDAQVEVATTHNFGLLGQTWS